MYITQEQVQALFIYQSLTGWLVNRTQRGRRGKIGERAGSFGADGYRCVQIGGQKFKEHRVIWLYIRGYMPDEIDHKDGNGYNNILTNLREATRSENIANSLREVGESGLRGVKFDPNTSSWRARVSFGNCREYLGPFDTAEEAYEAYLVAAEIRHGEFALHNRPTPNGE